MKNLMTRKLLFGMFITFVLAFGVQGIADALTFGTTRTGDLQWVSRGTTTPASDSLFTLEFDVTLTSRRLKNVNYRLVPSNATGIYDANTPKYYDASTYYIGDTDPNGATNPPNTSLTDAITVSESDAYYYNDQAVTITPPSNVRIVRIGNFNVAAGEQSAITLRQTETWPDGRTRRLVSGRIRATFAAPTAEANVARHEIQITDATTAADDYDGHGNATFTSFIVYSVKFAHEIQSGTTITEDGATDGYEIRYEDPDRLVGKNLSNSETSIPIRYTVRGPGIVYIQDGSRKSSTTTTLDTSSEAPVYLDMRGGTNRVTISSPGLDPVTAIYVLGPVTLEITHGNNQAGALGGRLEEHLGVRVRDGRNSGVAGVPVTFDANATGTAGRLLPYPGETVYLTAATPPTWVTAYADGLSTGTATSVFPPSGGPVVVQTNSSGEAKVYWELGSDAADTTQTVTVESLGRSDTFRASAESDTRRASLVIVSGDGQTANADTGRVKDPLVVRTRSTAEHRIAGVVIKFEVLAGDLTAGPGDTALSSVTINGVAVTVSNEWSRDIYPDEFRWRSFCLLQCGSTSWW